MQEDIGTSISLADEILGEIEEPTVEATEIPDAADQNNEEDSDGQETQDVKTEGEVEDKDISEATSDTEDDKKPEEDPYEKRFKDTQAAFNKANEEKVKLEKQLADVAKAKAELELKLEEKEQKSLDETEEAFINKYKQKIEEVGDDGYLEALREVYSLAMKGSKNSIEDIQSRVAEELVKQSVREKGLTDYDLVVDALLPAVKEDSDLLARVQGYVKNNDYLSAYNEGKKIYDAKVIAKDPEAYRKLVIEEYEKSRSNNGNGNKPASSLTLSSISSKKPQRTLRTFNSDQDVLDAVFG